LDGHAESLESSKAWVRDWLELQNILGHFILLSFSDEAVLLRHKYLSAFLRKTEKNNSSIFENAHRLINRSYPHVDKVSSSGKGLRLCVPLSGSVVVVFDEQLN
jgi:hypothetical protein